MRQINKHTTIFSRGSCYYSTIYQNRQTTNIIIYANKQRDKRQENTRYNVVHPTWATSTGRLSSIITRNLLLLIHEQLPPHITLHHHKQHGVSLWSYVCNNTLQEWIEIGLNRIQGCLMRLSYPYYIPRDVEELLSHITCGII